MSPTAAYEWNRETGNSAETNYYCLPTLEMRESQDLTKDSGPGNDNKLQ